MSVTSTQINACTDKYALLVAGTAASGDRSLLSGCSESHWGDAILQSGGLLTLPWQYWRELLRFWLENEHFTEWPYRVCGLTLAHDPPEGDDVLDALLTVAADRLGSMMSLTRGGSESLLAWSHRGLCAKLAGEQA